MKVTSVQTAPISGRIQPHNERSAAVWSSGGKAYDEISRGIADAIEHCVVRLNPLPGERILDLSTGTGWTSRVVARRGAQVMGADIAADLLAAARLKADAEDLLIEYRVADAENLPFADRTFDAVVSTFGVMFASNQEAAASELARIVRPGGRIALATWTADSSVFGMFQVMKRYMAAPPPTPSGQPPRSPFEWGKTERVSELLGRHFQLQFEKGTSYYREPSAEAAWHTFSTGYGPTRALAASLDANRREALRADFIAFHQNYPTDLGICVPREYLVTLGTRV
jgi:ubiquinone/menaquinone biosynthesis C-methylase UbiE